MPGWQDYALSIDRMCTAVWAGEDPKAALKKAAAEWDATTQRLGVETQKAAYEEFLKLPGSYADHTIEKLGHGGAHHLSDAERSAASREGDSREAAAGSAQRRQRLPPSPGWCGKLRNGPYRDR